MIEYQRYYQQYQIPPNLQLHQRRVTGVAKSITDTWIGLPINQDDLIAACLFHDMGNIIKFNLSNHTILAKDANTAHLLHVQQQFIKKYGTNVHEATLAICHEMGLNHSVIEALEHSEWNDVPELIKSNSSISCLLIYSDMRVGPFGILSTHERIENLATRSTIDIPKFTGFADQLATYIQPQTKTKLQSISDPIIYE